jgi:hypothetical protein
MRGALRFGAVCSFAAAASAQPDPGTYLNRDDFSSEALYATGAVTVGARAVGLGGAYTSIADDVAGLDFNPAGLAQIRRIEFGIGMRHHRDTSTHGMFGAESRETTTATGLDYVGFAYPFPTYRGSLVVGAVVQRVRDNQLESARADQRRGPGFQFDDRFLRRQDGGVWRLAGGVGVDVLPELSLGGSVAYWHGSLQDDQFRELDETVTGQPPLVARDRLRTDSNVDGFGFDLGLLGYVGAGGRLGLRISSPVWLDIQGDGELSLDDLNDGQPPNVQALVIDQRPRLPWSVTAGGSWVFGAALVAADLGYTAWDELDLDDRFGDTPPLADSDYSGHVSVRAGAELALPSWPLRGRAGYAFEPVVYELLLGNPARLTRDRHTWSVGAGVLLADVFALDVGASFARFERSDRDFAAVFESRHERRVVLTAAYRY